MLRFGLFDRVLDNLALGVTQEHCADDNNDQKQDRNADEGYFF
jgi:hypothetical protein